MVEPRGNWSNRHLRKIREIESQLGREICGVPTASGDPCRQWPVDASHGRCSQHLPQDRSGSDPPPRGSESRARREPVPADQPPPPAREPAPRESASGSLGGLFYWLILGLMGLLTGAGLMTGYVYYRDLSPGEPEPNQAALELNVNQPDFSRIRQLYRDGKIDRVAVQLETIVNKSSSRSSRAQALYLQFVLYQNQEDYQRALSVAERFTKTFKNHPRHPEVLYGAAFLCREFLNQPDRAREFSRRLRDRYPESKWTQKITSS